MAPKPDVSEARKNQIIEAATRVFTERGFDEARMDDIVDQSGLSKGTLYWYFDSKEAIIIAILDRIFDWETAQLRNILASEESAAMKLEVFIDASIEDIEKMKPLMPIFYEFWSLSARHKTVKQAIKRYYEQYLEMIKPIIQEGIEQGEFRAVDVVQTALAIGAQFEGTVLMWFYFPDTVNFEIQFKTNLDLLLRGMLVES